MFCGSSTRPFVKLQIPTKLSAQQFSKLERKMFSSCKTFISLTFSIHSCFREKLFHKLKLFFKEKHRNNKTDWSFHLWTIHEPQRRKEWKKWKFPSTLRLQNEWKQKSVDANMGKREEGEMKWKFSTRAGITTKYPLESSSPLVHLTLHPTTMKAFLFWFSRELLLQCAEAQSLRSYNEIMNS